MVCQRRPFFTSYLGYEPTTPLHPRKGRAGRGDLPHSGYTNSEEEKLRACVSLWADWLRLGDYPPTNGSAGGKHPAGKPRCGLRLSAFRRLAGRRRQTRRSLRRALDARSGGWHGTWVREISSGARGGGADACPGSPRRRQQLLLGSKPRNYQGNLARLGIFRQAFSSIII